MIFSLLRLCICSCLLLYASYSDMKTREVSNAVWVLMSASGVFLLCIEFFTFLSVSAGLPFAFPFAFDILKSLMAASILSFILLRLNFGGADAKALISIAILFPYFPTTVIPAMELLVPPLNIFVLSTLTNALLIAISVPLFLFFFNLFSRVHSPLWFMFIGYRVPIAELKGKKHLKLLVDPESGKYVWGGVDLELKEDARKILEEKGKGQGQGKEASKVWVTPELPFLVYLTAGFFIAAFYGDVLFALLL